MPLLLLQISKPLVKQVLLLLEASRIPHLLLQVSKLLARKVLLLQLHRVNPPLQPGRQGPIPLPVRCTGLLLKLPSGVSPPLV
jgi:hypothetical protein